MFIEDCHFAFCSKALDMHLAVTILRIAEGMDFSKKLTFGEEPSTVAKGQSDNKSKASSDECLRNNPSNHSLSQMSHGMPVVLFSLFILWPKLHIMSSTYL